MLNFPSFVKFTKTILFYSFLIWCVLFLIKCNFFNSCLNYEDYYNVYSTSNCSYIPDNYETPPEIIRRHTGVSETHKVTTEDGYILTLFRIPKKNPKGVILFQHGYAVDSSYWLAQSNESVALYFWKADYDVWLANSRGTDYSKQHVNLSSEDEEFWKFSFHEVGYYDVNASIDYIKDITKVDKIVYIGFSLGSTAGSIYACLRPEKAEDSIKIMIQLSPIAYATSSPVSIFKYALPPFADHSTVSKFHRLTKKYWIFGYDAWYLRLTRFTYKYFPFKKLMSYFVSVLVGWTPDETDPVHLLIRILGDPARPGHRELTWEKDERQRILMFNFFSFFSLLMFYVQKYINLMTDKYGSSSAWQSWQHCAQIHKHKNKFMMYDYGKEENLKLYGNESPPLYPLENIKIPIFLVNSRDDWLGHHEDGKLLYDMLPDRAKIYGRLEIEGFNHMDYFFGRRRIEKIYDELFKLLDKIT